MQGIGDFHPADINIYSVALASLTFLLPLLQYTGS